MNTTIGFIVDARERGWRMLTDEQRRMALVPNKVLSQAGATSPG